MKKRSKSVSKTPYRKLLERVRPLFRELVSPQKHIMFWYKKETIVSVNGVSVLGLYERTLAAQQLGWRVVVSARDGGLVFEYEKEKPPIDWELRFQE